MNRNTFMNEHSDDKIRETEHIEGNIYESITSLNPVKPIPISRTVTIDWTQIPTPVLVLGMMRIVLTTNLDLNIISNLQSKIGYKMT